MAYEKPLFNDVEELDAKRYRDLLKHIKSLTKQAKGSKH